jgi:DNA-binding MarR family transcriptional regulator
MDGADRLSPEERALWHAIKTLGDSACLAVARDLTAQTDISGADFAVLSRVLELGDGTLSQRALLASLGWDKSRLSHQLRRMAERGLVARDLPGEVPSVALSEAGRAALSCAYPVHAAAIRARALRHVRPAERAALIALAQRVESALKD